MFLACRGLSSAFNGGHRNARHCDSFQLDWQDRNMQEQLSPELVGRFNATLGSDFSVAVGESAPLLIHLCLAQPALPADQLGEDGHPRRGGFLPPVPLPRRMRAGGEMTFLGPLPIGAQVKRHSTIRHIEEKQGNSGRLCFVTVQHDISADGTPAAGWCAVLSLIHI